MENEKKVESFVTIADLWNLCAARWRWFVLSIFVCTSFAVYYLLTTPYLYNRYASIMVLEESLGKNTTESNMNEFSKIGFVNQKSNVPNVVRHITSLDILMEVAHRTDSSLTGDQIIEKAKAIQSRLTAEKEDLFSTVINLVYKDYSTTEATNVLNLIIQVYNDKWMEEKVLTIKNTSRFIDSRLKLLEKGLDTVDDSIAVYKARYGITNLEHVSDIYLQQQSKSDAEILTLSNQKAMAEYIRSLLTDDSPERQLLLVNSGIDSEIIESQITLYNSLLMQLKSHLQYTSVQNPIITNLENQLDELRENILSNINSHISTIDIQLLAIKGYHGETISKITSNPAQSKFLEGVHREQKVKESLYLYLLQKREENEISTGYKTSNMQVIDIPHGPGKPSSPDRPKVLMAAVLLGFMLPVTMLFLRASFDETVRDHFDIERYSDIPFLGEVPYSGREHSIDSLLMKFGYGQKAKSSGIVVGPDMLDASNEAFRILLNNMEAIVSNKSLDKTGRVYLVKSTQIEAGKTYIAMNLALTKAIGGRHVLFIDGDLRQASASRLWRTPLHGLTDYLHEEVHDYHQLLWQPEGYTNIDVLPSGALPLHPTELLRSPLLAQLLDNLRKEYDCIIIDSPSAGMLADADIIEQLSDCTLFVIRAGRFNRNRLNELKPVHARDKNNLQYVILNGVSISVRYGSAYLHKYERSEKDKKRVTISRKTILLNKIIFKQRKHHHLLHLFNRHRT